MDIYFCFVKFEFNHVKAAYNFKDNISEFSYLFNIHKLTEHNYSIKKKKIFYKNIHVIKQTNRLK